MVMSKRRMGKQVGKGYKSPNNALQIALTTSRMTLSTGGAANGWGVWG